MSMFRACVQICRPEAFSESPVAWRQGSYRFTSLGLSYSQIRKAKSAPQPPE
jgi:hypothetical protein